MQVGDKADADGKINGAKRKQIDMYSQKGGVTDMVIKRWSELPDAEKEQAKQYLEHFSGNPFGKSWEERWEFFIGPVFSHGDELYFVFGDERIKGSLGLVLQEIEVKGEAYITQINGVGADAEAMACLLEAAADRCTQAGARKIMAGIRPDCIHWIPAVQALGFEAAYRLLVLKKDARTLYGEKGMGSLMQLTPETAAQYARIMTHAFHDSPNGATVTEEEALQLIKSDNLVGLYGPVGDHESGGERTSGANHASVANAASVDGHEPVAAYELAVRDGIGWIEALAVLPQEQGKGYGRTLFRLAQNLLWSREDVTRLKMTVMDANKHAYAMYLAHGFEVESIGSHWFVKVVEGQEALVE